MLAATLAANKWEPGLNHAVRRLVPPTAWRPCFHQVLLRAAQTALITNGKLTKQRLVEYVAKATAIVAPTVTVACTGQLHLPHHQRPCGLTWLTAFAIVAKVLKSLQIIRLAGTRASTALETMDKSITCLTTLQRLASGRTIAMSLLTSAQRNGKLVHPVRNRRVRPVRKPPVICQISRKRKAWFSADPPMKRLISWLEFSPHK